MEQAQGGGSSALHRRLLDAVGGQIVDGTLAPGHRLLTTELAEGFHASRSAMREVVRVLESLGMIVVRRRAGAQVQSAEHWSPYAPEIIRWRLAGPDRITALHELSQLRSAVEPLAARLAASRATGEERAAMIGAVMGMTEHSDQADGDAYLENDIAFHAAILRASGNPYLAGLTRVVSEVLHGRTAHELMPAQADPLALRQHQNVAAAISARDPDAAAAAMSVIVAEADAAVSAISGESATAEKG